MPNFISKYLVPKLAEESDRPFATPESEMSDELKARREKFQGVTDVAKVVDSFKGLYDWQLNRARHAESRAATIQGAVSIVASLALDRAKINDSGLRYALAALAALAILAFVAAALRAMQAHMTVHEWARPDIHNISGESVSALTAAQEAGEYWGVISLNEPIVAWKLDRLRQAKVHFRNGILTLGLLAVAVAVTVVADASPPAKGPTQVEIIRKP